MHLFDCLLGLRKVKVFLREMLDVKELSFTALASRVILQRMSRQNMCTNVAVLAEYLLLGSLLKRVAMLNMVK